jgi:hypothetical protein
MIPVEQRIVAGPTEDPRGDCYKCAIASILELPYEDVPHFVNGEWLVDYGDGLRKADSYSAFCNWLKVKGYPIHPTSVVYHNSDNPMNKMYMHDYEHEKPRNHHFGYWIGSVKSVVFEGGHHVVVMKGWDVVYDPSPHRDIYEEIGYDFYGEMWFECPEPWQVVALVDKQPMVDDIVIPGETAALVRRFMGGDE